MLVFARIPYAVAFGMFPDLERKEILSRNAVVGGKLKNASDPMLSLAKFSYSELEAEVFQKEIAFNIIPSIGKINTGTGQSEEEEKIPFELNKIFNSDIGVSASCVRVPTFIGHCISVNIEMMEGESIDVIKDALSMDDRIIYSDEDIFTPQDITESDKTYISRVRADNSIPNAINLWLVADNLVRGAAFNSIKILEYIISLHP